MNPYVIYSIISVVLILYFFINFPILVFIHEVGHIIAIVLYSREYRVKVGDLGIRIEWLTFKKAKAHCIYKTFSTDQIEKIAVAGDLFATPCSILIGILLAWPFWILIEALLKMTVACPFPYIIKIVLLSFPFIIQIISVILEWAFKKEYKSNKNMSDKLVYKYPKEFLEGYEYPEKYKRKN